MSDRISDVWWVVAGGGETGGWMLSRGKRRGWGEMGGEKVKRGGGERGDKQ